jgi:hypothetical protein
MSVPHARPSLRNLLALLFVLLTATPVEIIVDVFLGMTQYLR